MNRRVYKRLLLRQGVLDAEVKALLAKWSKITGIVVDSIERLTPLDEKLIIRFREIEVRPDEVQRLHCARDLELPARLLWSKNQDEDLRSEILASIKIRPATEADAEGMCWVHWKAVHLTAAEYGYYGPRILHDWSPAVDSKRIDTYRQHIKTRPDNRVVIVAVIARRIIGFGVVVPDKNYLNALYVSPEGNGKNVGVRLLQQLETLARNAGCKYLEMHASMNAEGFYKKHGYERGSLVFHVLHTGLEMPCVLMRKQFS